ncbi:uncharacterized protein LOC107261847, partial [Ricinus communis]|uniref:uncharacterized protein LOC107261847 n=1 Tax=Ricinus communis TaxID=3988 RepID=UPI00201B1E28
GIFTPEILSVCHKILHYSLRNQLIPAFNEKKNYLLSYDENVICAIKKFQSIVLSHLEFYVVPNIKMLKDSGLPDSRIVWLLRAHPMIFITSLDRFAEIVGEIKEMGLNPSQKNFVSAICVMRKLRKFTWKKKFDVYEKWGWSEEETLVAFGKYPLVMMCSEKKIMEMMDFYINKMRWDSSSVANHPVLISLSLEKRVIPCCSVLRVLLSKGLIRLTSLATSLKIFEELFLHKFVMPYGEEAPNLLRLYQEKLNVAKCEARR